jgi:hypothetical protein
MEKSDCASIDETKKFLVTFAFSFVIMLCLLDDEAFLNAWIDAELKARGELKCPTTMN